MVPNKHITKLNILLMLVYLFLDRTTRYLFKPITNEKVPWDSVYEWSKPISILGAIVIALFMVVLMSVIIRTFWNKLLSDVFKIRAINFNESTAIALIIVLITI